MPMQQRSDEVAGSGCSSQPEPSKSLVGTVSVYLDTASRGSADVVQRSAAQFSACQIPFATAEKTCRHSGRSGLLPTNCTMAHRPSRGRHSRRQCRPNFLGKQFPLVRVVVTTLTGLV